MSLATALLILDSRRDELAANLVAMGVTAADTETLSSLIAKVLTIEGGGSPPAEVYIDSGWGNINNVDEFTMNLADSGISA